MDKHIHKGDVIFALVLAYFLCSYRFLEIDPATFGWARALQLVFWYGIIAASFEIIFVLVSCLRQKPLFGNRKMAFFAWKRVLPIAFVISGASVACYYFMLPEPTTLQIYILITEFVVGFLAIVLYFYSLVKRK